MIDSLSVLLYCLIIGFITLNTAHSCAVIVNLTGRGGGEGGLGTNRMTHGGLLSVMAN